MEVRDVKLTMKAFKSLTVGFVVTSVANNLDAAVQQIDSRSVKYEDKRKVIDAPYGFLVYRGENATKMVFEESATFGMYQGRLLYISTHGVMIFKSLGMHDY